MNDTTDLTIIVNDLAQENANLKAAAERHREIVDDFGRTVATQADQINSLLTKHYDANDRIRTIVKKLEDEHGMDRAEVYELFGFEAPKKEFIVRMPVQAMISVRIEAATEDEAMDLLGSGDSAIESRITRAISGLWSYDYEVDPNGDAHVEDDNGYVSNYAPNFIN